MIEKTLKDIGLSQNEIKIYLSLIELGPSLIGKICGKTKIHRRNVYDSIEMLKDKGFISATMINNRNVFEAVNPKRILDILDEKKVNIEKILPQLMNKQSKNESLVKVYTGLNGRKIIFEDKLKFLDTQYVLGAHNPSKKISRYIENYHRRRIEKKIHTKMLFIKEDKQIAQRFREYKYIQARLLPNKFSSPLAINIYGKKIAILLGSQTIEPITILIEDEALSNDFKSYFQLLWGISTDF
jgi:sugar-specific transcriptional regulator TrmB